MTDEETKQKMLELLAKKTWYPKDIAKKLKIPRKDASKIINELIAEGKAKYWSLGSTVKVTTPELADKLEKGRKEG